jgi:FG-GAP-like repeat/ASPIC and UnbV
MIVRASAGPLLIGLRSLATWAACTGTLLGLTACGGGGRSGTARMAAMLRKIDAEAAANPLPYPQLNRRRVQLMEQDFERAPGLRRRPDVRLLFAYELLGAGDVDQSILELRSLLPPTAEGGYALAPATKPVFELLGAAYLHQDMQHNCLNDDTGEACLLPLSPHAPHAWQEGSRLAASMDEQVLTLFPDDLDTRWLLNVAEMTLGGYPDSVPARWRIPGLQRSPDAHLPRFRNVAPAVGLAVQGMSGGADLEDFNDDGFLDVFTTSYGMMDPVHLFLADGHGRFVDRTHAAGLDGIVGGLNTVHADYDNDGDNDILILRGAWLGSYGAQPNSLLRNNGDGTFEDVTSAAGLLTLHPTQTAAWADFNLDGFLDLFIGNESGGLYGGMGAAPQPSVPGPTVQSNPTELFLNNGDGTFTDVAARVGLDIKAFVKGVAWGDVNNDGLPDLFVSVLGGPNRLYINRGGTSMDDWRFEEAAAAAGVQQPLFSFACWFWDFDNDGWQDLFVATYDPRYIDAGSELAREFLGLGSEGERARLYRNQGNGTFVDVAPEVGLDRAFYAMGANFGDLDNDGYPDLYIGTGTPDFRALIPNRMFLNHDGKRFEEVTFDGGFGHLGKGHAIAFGDVDRDGDQDIYAVMGGGVEGEALPNVLFENPNPSPEDSWIGLKLEGRAANRSAIGARIRITVEDPRGNIRTVYKTVSTGGSFGSSSLQQEIGLGPASHLRELQVKWPDRQRTVEVYRDLSLDRYYAVVQGEGVRPLGWVPVPLATHRAADPN